ncbi:hypothetical protein [Legionella shakespearei]|uniref:Substrate of the Dot/Icm secretion system n=1 Tax=Legionella shakespearei DSM 23087 TaxID=1122169 RepID=A0A0W0YQ85_9GAMM|nr:hypothetical protein [Legionella shakespearei]KTD59034.1 substrate of the Dot/Icm secretion system [Legionella shakespearei DSM 23087]
MAFTPPAYSVLRVNTLNLDARLSTLLGRYKIVDNQTAVATTSSTNPAPLQTSLEILLARINQVIECDTDRLTARDVFKQLGNELRDVLKEGDETKNQRATLFLLGALLHRYFRIINEYKGSYTGWFVTPNPLNSDLFKAIRGALQLPGDVTVDDYQMRDLKILDVTTIVTALEAFRDNMYLKDQEGIERYKKYPHLKADSNFEIHLKEIIDQHTARGRTTVNQFKAVRFIQSLRKQVDVDQQQVENALNRWCKEFARAHPDFDGLDLETIEGHIKKYFKEDPIKENILDLVNTPLIKDNLNSMSHASFPTQMKLCHAKICSFILVGGYSMLLQSEHVKKDLRFKIYEALDIVKDPSVLSSADMDNGIKLFNMFRENNTQIDLDYEFFGDKEKMETFISQTELALTSKIQAEKEQKAQEQSAKPATIALV